MVKLCDLVDELCNLEKRVFALELLSEVDIKTLNDREFNSWVGLLFDSVDLLSQTCSDLRILGDSLSNFTNGQ